MSIQRYWVAAILTLILLGNSTPAQNTATKDAAAQPAPLSVTASASTGGVRFTSPGQVLQIQLAIYNASGDLVFDSGRREGSILDWKVVDASQAVTDGSYLCVVTVKDFQGKIRQKLGVMNVQAGQASVSRLREGAVTEAQSRALAAGRQSQKLEATESNESLTVLVDKERSATIAAHDGENGQLTSTKGALTFRTGNVFSGADKEHVRITPEGRVGIGTDNPSATLDVDGTIRARGGIVFEDGTVLKSAGGLTGTSGVQIGVNGRQPGTQVNGVQTQGGSDTVTPNAYESGGLTFFGQNHAGQAAPLFPGAESYHVVEIGAPGTKSPLTMAGGSGVMEFWKDLGGGTGAPSAAVSYGMAKPGTAATDDLVLSTYKAGIGWNERMRIMNGGNVGIGTTAPTAKLDVVGNIKLSGAGSQLIFPDGSVMTSALAGGGQMSGDQIVGALNNASTVGVINDARLPASMARLGGANVWSGANTFGAGLSANNALITNVGNPVNAGDAVNKAYTDANFVKFVPGAEQLSVGDANGTATMINLRGGSTCCSGPGGHTPAFFKVFQNGSFVATGNLGIGTSPMEGKGYRTSWHTYKGAFRSGYADNEWDDANVGFFSWAGGSNSTASGLYALAFGDTNFARSTSSIAFGSGNEVKGAAGFSAGAGNRVCDTYGVALGNNAKSGGPYIDGKCDPETFNIRGLAAIAIGYNVTADQDHTTALGKFASNNSFHGTFIWSDGAPQASADTFRNTANNEFAARATGGFRFRTNLGGTTGCNLPAGSGVFNCTSSRATKENFTIANGEDVLARLRKIPVSTWNYITEGRQVRHMGPMAEDFYKEFGLGTNNISIGVQDLAGVSLAAVKALEVRTAQLNEKAAEVDQLRAEVEQLRTANASMEQRLAAIEQSLKANAEAAGKKKR